MSFVDAIEKRKDKKSFVDSITEKPKVDTTNRYNFLSPEKPKQDTYFDMKLPQKETNFMEDLRQKVFEPKIDQNIVSPQSVIKPYEPTFFQKAKDLGEDIKTKSYMAATGLTRGIGSEKLIDLTNKALSWGGIKEGFDNEKYQKLKQESESIQPGGSEYVDYVARTLDKGQGWTPSKADTYTEIGGNIAGNIAKQIGTYNLAGAIGNAVPLLNKINNPIIRTLVTDQLIDNIAQTPAVIASNVLDKKGFGETAKELAIQNLIDAGLNITLKGADIGANKLKNFVKELKNKKILDVISFEKDLGKQYNDIRKSLNLPEIKTPKKQPIIQTKKQPIPKITQQGNIKTKQDIENVLKRNFESQKDIDKAVKELDNAPINLQRFAKDTKEKLLKDIKPFKTADGGSVESAMSKINFDIKKEKPKFKELFSKLKTELVDKYEPLRKAEIKIKGKLQSAEKSLYKQARLFEGVLERANKIIEDNLNPIIKSVEDKGYSYKDLALYAEAVHAKDVNAKGINSGFTKEEIEQVINKYKDTPLEEARKKLVEYSDNRLKDLVDSQIITKQQYQAMKDKWKNYMPLNRVFDDDKVEFGQALSKSFSNVQAPIKGLKGSERNVINPIESLIKNTYATENAIARNRVGLEVSRLSRTKNDLIKQVDPSEITNRQNIIKVKEFGEDTFYEVTPELYKALKNLNKEATNTVIKILSKPASVLRAGATLTPEFAIRNPLRDIWNAIIVSESGFTPLDFIIGLKSTVKKDEMYKNFIMNKGAYGNIMSMDRNLHKQNLEKILKQKPSDKFVNIINPKSWVELLRKVSDVTESATKVGEFQKALKKGATPEEAAYRARDLMDFARSGNVTKEANKIISFLNANIQGKDKLIRAFKNDPKGVSARLLTTMTLPTIGFFAARELLGNEKQKATIKDAPDWLKNTFWLVPVPNTDIVARIPKPFDVSIVANFTERFLDYWVKNDKDSFDNFIKSNLQSQSIPIMITGIQPLIEAATNYSFFREAPIIPRREEYLQSKDQYDIYTSQVAKAIAKGTSKVFGQESKLSSPRIIDYVLKSSTAGLGTYGLDAIDFITGTNKPAKNKSQQPFVRAFTVNPQASGKSMEFVYNTKEKLTKEKNSNKTTFNKNLELNYLNRVTKEIGAISSKIREIQNSKDLSPEEKREQLNILTDLRNKITRESQEEYKRRFEK